MAWRSNSTGSLLAAMVGEHVHQRVRVCATDRGATSSIEITDLSGLLILGGDVELNPGPVEGEEVQKAIDNLYEKFSVLLSSELGKLRADMNKISADIKLVEAQLSGIGNKLEAHEAWLEEMQETQKTHDDRLEE